MKASQELVDVVIEQMKIDIASEDWTAIEELLKSVPEDRLHGFLSDIKPKEINHE